MNKLVIQDDEGKTTVVPLIRDEITIGRKEGNTIRLTERNVSRRHARILRANGAVAIEDLNSYNGVRVNGSRISGRCQLSVSDRIQIGDYLIELKGEGEEAADSYGEQRTQPIERVDPMGATPQPEVAGQPQPGPTAIVDTNRIQGQPQPASYSPQAVADTDPGASGNAVPVEAPATPARMVILSTNFAGQDYPLTKPAMVIGRTDDNDIVVNHRSISRHHAKVVQENGRFAIVDLQSSNGVRVNGEEYGKVELRRGDVVDLGHVRLRFVEAGEDFVFGRDAQPVDISTGGGKGMIFALLALLVVGGGIGIFVLTSGGGGGEKVAASQGDGDGEGEGTDPSAAGAPADDDSGDGDSEPAAMRAADDSLVAKARAAIEAERWEEAKKIAEEALAEDPDDPDAQEILDQAEREMKDQVVYDQFKEAVTGKKYLKVAELFRQITPTSVYKEQARDDHDRMRDEYIAEVVSKARGMVPKCRDIARLSADAEKVWPEAGEAVDEVHAACKTQVAARADKPDKSDRKTSRGTNRGSKTNGSDSNGGGSSGGGSGGSTSGKSAEELTTDARAAAKTGHWGKALRLCEAALAKKGGDQEAAMVCALAACNIKSASKAKRYMGKLRSPSRKGMARQICLKNGVDIPIQ